MVAVISNTGIKLMPTNEARARKLLKSGKALIHKHKPFTIQLTDKSDGEVQPIEFKMDTGYQHIGISIASEKHEFVNAQYDMLKDEPERHHDCHSYRQTRRNRKTRHRAKRFNNRRDTMIVKDGFAPSIRHKRDLHIALFEMYNNVLPITEAFIEMGQFDTQVLTAIEASEPLPQGVDYQHGEQYGYATLREAVFNRDNYTCICCGKSAFKDNAILQIHHLGYLIGDRSNRMNNLASVCTKCHTPKNHKPGGKLYDLRPKLKTFNQATFMTMVRFDMFKKLKEIDPNVIFHMTYGAATKLARHNLHVGKSHSNDAYCMGTLHPKHRTDFKHYQKCRRNNRILSAFYDAKYIDLRDGSKKSGQQLPCNRNKRYELRNNPNNERKYRGQKISKGRWSIRTQHYMYRPGDIVTVKGVKDTVIAIQNRGAMIKLTNHGIISTNRVKLYKHTGGWKEVA